MLTSIKDGTRVWYVNTDRIAYVTARFDLPNQTLIAFSGNEDDWVCIDAPLDDVMKQIQLS